MKGSGVQQKARRNGGHVDGEQNEGEDEEDLANGVQAGEAVWC